MPHLTLQYTTNIDGIEPASLLRAMNAAAVASTLFDAADVKSRAVALQQFQNGLEGDRSGFVHVTIAMSTRSHDEEKALSKAVADALEETLPNPLNTDLQLCVEIVHVDTSTYVKRLLRTPKGNAP
ncbi:hypothetical protein BH09PSE5_BH09PSE5_10920 [soil metagenome]